MRTCKFPGCITILSKHNGDRNYCFTHSRKLANNNIEKDSLGYYTIKTKAIKINKGKKTKWKNIKEKVRISNYSLKQLKDLVYED